MLSKFESDTSPYVKFFFFHSNSVTCLVLEHNPVPLHFPSPQSIIVLKIQSDLLSIDPSTFTTRNVSVSFQPTLPQSPSRKSSFQPRRRRSLSSDIPQDEPYIGPHRASTTASPRITSRAQTENHLPPPPLRVPIASLPPPHPLLLPPPHPQIRHPLQPNRHRALQPITPDRTSIRIPFPPSALPLLLLRKGAASRRFHRGRPSLSSALIRWPPKLPGLSLAQEKTLREVFS